MKKVLTIVGGSIGLLFSILDSVVSYSDTAPIDEYGISIISWQFFIKKMVVYILIGGGLGWLIGFIVDKLKRNKN
ncbi:hypothetical protein AB3466_11925 [Sphingobacterium thalpophilum]|uniref:hypothetical protein n=1 Tax=Sphingobacterium TaxID=28453 RepID=UPI0022440A2E|nr:MULTISPECIES: hypothetical protein [Sphingobacterium]MCW8313120.1 hypothetical protein [Sphingobacterium sp. InxBP1]